MSINFPKTLMVLLVCLTFIGQAMASTVMSYHMMNMNMESMSSETQSNGMSKMDHSGHNMAMVADFDDPESSADDCCDKTCTCFAGGCSSMVAVIKDLSYRPIGTFSAKIYSNSNLALSQQLTSLYRPPILS